jgi:predicted RNase H-like nuclease (RuvC/YqgF family)
VAKLHARGKNPNPCGTGVAPSEPEEGGMTLEDEVRKCCEDIEKLQRETKDLKGHCAEEVKEDVSGLESKLERLLRESRAAGKPGAPLPQPLEAVLAAWRHGCDRLRTHLKLVEAKSNLASARRLADDQYYVAAESALTTALRQVTDARAALPADDPELTALVQEIERAVADIHAKADSAAATLEKLVAHNEQLLAALDAAA